MSVRNGIVLLLALSALLFLGACGSNSITHPVAPPSGNFSNSNLNGTYVFSVLGVDQASGAPYAIVGTLTANGSGGITGALSTLTTKTQQNSPPDPSPTSRSTMTAPTT